MDLRIDTAVALAFAAFGLFVISQAMQIPTGVVRDPVGPRAAFYLCGGLLTIGGGFLALRNISRMKRGRGPMVESEGSPDEGAYPASFLRAAALAALCLVYALLFVPLGYLLATPIFVLCALFILDQRGLRLNLLIALGFTAIAFVVFSYFLGVRMPFGPLTGPLRELGWITL